MLTHAGRKRLPKNVLQGPKCPGPEAKSPSPGSRHCRDTVDVGDAVVQVDGAHEAREDLVRERREPLQVAREAAEGDRKHERRDADAGGREQLVKVDAG
eukprot:4567282-Prymnesium_polylepis.1